MCLYKIPHKSTQYNTVCSDDLVIKWIQVIVGYTSHNYPLCSQLRKLSIHNIRISYYLDYCEGATGQV